MKNLDIQVLQSAKSVKIQERVLPEKSNTSPKHFANAIMVDGEEHYGNGELNELNNEDFGDMTSVLLDTLSKHIVGRHKEHVPVDTTS